MKNSFTILDTLLITFSILFTHAAAQLTNMIWDIPIDRVNKPFRPLVTGEIRRKIALILDTSFVVTAFSLALIESVVNPEMNNFVFRILLLMFFALFFTLGPVRRNPWSHCIWMGLTRGLLPPLVVYGFENFFIWQIAILMFTWVTFFNVVKDFPDVKGDKLFGIKTLVNTYGEKFTIRYLYIGAAVFYTLVLTLTILNVYVWKTCFNPVTMILTIPLALTIPKTVHMPPAFSDNNLAYDLFWWGLTLNYALLTTSLLLTC